MILPEYFQQVKSMPDDPEGSMAYMTGNEEFQAFALVYPIPTDSAMPYNDDASIIYGIHNTVSEEQALIEVNSGETKSGKPYVYSIVKTQMKPHGMQYTLILHIKDSDAVSSCLRSFFSESGMTGQRDTMVYAALSQNGTVKMGDTSTWMRDPYNSNLKDRFLMNLSEREEFDQYFPNHPLTVARLTVKEIVENN